MAVCLPVHAAPGVDVTSKRPATHCPAGCQLWPQGANEQSLHSKAQSQCCARGSKQASQKLLVWQAPTRSNIWPAVAMRSSASDKGATMASGTPPAGPLTAFNPGLAGVTLGTLPLAGACCWLKPPGAAAALLRSWLLCRVWMLRSM